MLKGIRTREQLGGPLVEREEAVSGHASTGDIGKGLRLLSWLTPRHLGAPHRRSVGRGLWGECINAPHQTTVLGLDLGAFDLVIEQGGLEEGTQSWNGGPLSAVKILAGAHTVRDDLQVGGWSSGGTSGDQ